MLEWQEVRRRRGIAAFVTVLAAVALIAPLRPSVTPETSIGVLLGIAALLEWLHGQRRPTLRERMGAWREGAVTLLMAVLLLSAPLLSGGALVVFLAAQFLWEGVRRLAHVWTRPEAASLRRRLITGSLDVLAAAGLLVLLRANTAVTWIVAVAASVRLLDSARRLAAARVISAEAAGDSLIEDLNLSDIAQARAYGAGGVPFFVVDQKYALSGAQPTEVFTQVLERAWAETHPALEAVGGAGADACGPDGCAI